MVFFESPLWVRNARIFIFSVKIHSPPLTTVKREGSKIRRAREKIKKIPTLRGPFIPANPRKRIENAFWVLAKNLRSRNIARNTGISAIFQTSNFLGGE